MRNQMERSRQSNCARSPECGVLAFMRPPERGDAVFVTELLCNRVSQGKSVQMAVAVCVCELHTRPHQPFDLRAPFDLDRTRNSDRIEQPPSEQRPQSNKRSFFIGKSPYFMRDGDRLAFDRIEMNSGA